MKNKADRALIFSGLFFLGIVYIEYGLKRYGGGLALSSWMIQIIQVLKGTAVAAVIGGLADWYGVTSIFGRPLRIPFRTEIAYRRKDSFIESIKDFIAEDILSEENVRGGLIELDLSEKIMGWLEVEKTKKGGLLRLASELLEKVALEILRNLDTHGMTELIRRAVAQEFVRTKPSSLLVKFAEGLLAERHFPRIVHRLGGEAEKLLDLSSIKEFIQRGIDMAVDEYTDSGKGRGLVAVQIKLKLNHAVYTGARNWLQQLRRGDSGVMEELHGSAKALLDKFQNDEAAKEKLDARILRFINENPAVTEQVEGLMIKLIEKLEKSEAETVESIERTLNKGVELLLSNSEIMDHLENRLEEFLVVVIERNRVGIKNLVDKNLRILPEKELMAFLRENTDHELQYIRLNGMFFGTLIGFLVFVFRLL